MIRIRMLEIVLGASICLCACQNMDGKTSLLENPIKLKGEILPTSRVTDLDLQSTRFVEGQLAGVTIVNARSEHENVAWIADANGYLTNMGTEVSWGIGEITVYAYHPYSVGMSISNSFTISTDQSTIKGYLNSDLLWAKKTTTKTDAPIALSFKHKLAKLNVMLKSDSYDDLSGATISICGTDIATRFNPLTGELTPSDEKNVKDIKASVTTSVALQASCVIIPQTVAGGTTFIKIDYDGSTYNYKLQETIAFEGGKAYVFTININKNNPGDVGAVVPIIPWG